MTCDTSPGIDVDTTLAAGTQPMLFPGMHVRVGAGQVVAVAVASTKSVTVAVTDHPRPEPRASVIVSGCNAPDTTA